MPLSVFLYTGFVRQLPGTTRRPPRSTARPRSPPSARSLSRCWGRRPARSRSSTSLIIWNDFFTSLVFLSGSDAVTLPVVVYSFVGELVSKWNVIFAAVILSMILFLAFYLFAQKKFIQGFAGGIKS